MPSGGNMASNEFSPRIYKGIGPRFGAQIIDSIVIGVAVGALVVPLAFLTPQPDSTAASDPAAFNAYIAALGGQMLGLAFVGLGVPVLYFIVLEAFGTTVGKRVLGMCIIDAQGNKPGWRKSIVRNLLRIIDMLPTSYILGAVSMASSDTSQRIGDKVAGTYVVGRHRGE